VPWTISVGLPIGAPLNCRQVLIDLSLVNSQGEDLARSVLQPERVQVITHFYRIGFAGISHRGRPFAVALLVLRIRKRDFTFRVVEKSVYTMLEGRKLKVKSACGVRNREDVGFFTRVRSAEANNSTAELCVPLRPM